MPAVCSAMSTLLQAQDEAALLFPDSTPRDEVRAAVREYATSTYTFDRADSEMRFVLRLIHRHLPGRRVLDLGCGPTLPVTSLFHPEAEEGVGVDALRENLDFVRDEAHLLEPLVERALRYKRRHLSPRATRPRLRLVHGDVRERLPLRGFDAAMQIGCFACLDTPEALHKAMTHVHGYLKPGGWFLNVNWIQVGEGLDTRRLYRPALEAAGFESLEVHASAARLSPASRRMGYTHMTWAITRKPPAR